MDLISQLRRLHLCCFSALWLHYFSLLSSLHWKAKPASQEFIRSHTCPVFSIKEEFLLVIIFLHYYSCFRDKKRLLHPEVSTLDQWASNPTLNCNERGSMQRNGGTWRGSGDEFCLRVHWQVQIDKDGLILLILCLSSLSVDEQTQDNVILANTSANGFSCQCSTLASPGGSLALGLFVSEWGQ